VDAVDFDSWDSVSVWSAEAGGLEQAFEEAFFPFIFSMTSRASE